MTEQQTQEMENNKSSLESESSHTEEIKNDHQDSGEAEQVGEESQGDASPAEAEDFKEKYMYLAAEMDNLRKRTAKDRQEFLKYGKENILRDFLDLSDNFERMLSSLTNVESDEAKNILVGVEMVKKQLDDLLTNHGLQKIDSSGKEFDPTYHEALTSQESEGPENVVLHEIRSGFMLHDRLVRAAQVVVSKKKADSEGDSEEN